jgi:hypothetical protein
MVTTNKPAEERPRGSYGQQTAYTRLWQLLLADPAQEQKSNTPGDVGRQENAEIPINAPSDSSSSGSQNKGQP